MQEVVYLILIKIKIWMEKLQKYGKYEQELEGMMMVDVGFI